jgi:hypothetical protein
LDARVSAVIVHDLWEEVLVVNESDAALQQKLAERLGPPDRQRRRQIANRLRSDGVPPPPGPMADALASL